MKAGLATDQTEINRIIADASKGSKFYENEKRKDKDLTERITRILKLRDDAVRGADIVHVDMDAFYASVELLDDPSLQGKPFAVGHGVVSTASYEARKRGVRSGMAEFIAKKLCPELIVVSTHFPRYMDLSKSVMNIFRRYDPSMQPGGCDEGYLNITDFCEEHLVSAADCVQEMRDVVHRETGLTVSAGIAPNKMLAKICSDKNKPNGQFMLDFNRDAVKAFMRDLPIRKIPGVGRVNERLLDSIGIKTCGDIYTHRATVSLMDKQFGLMFLLQTYLGIASNVVQPLQREERKSIGAERTFHSIQEKDKILAKLEEVAAELEEDMERTGWTGKTVTLKYKLDTYQGSRSSPTLHLPFMLIFIALVFTRAKSFDRWISTKKEDLFAIGKELLLPELPLKLRLIGLRVTKLKDLRQDSEAKPGSIKRFFESSSTSTLPRKKRKFESNEDTPSLSQDGYEESMPIVDDDTESEADEYPSEPQSGDNKRRPPVSAPASTVASSSKGGRFVTKPLSSAESSNSHVKSPSGLLPVSDSPTGVALEGAIGVTTHLCPLCAKTMETDNQGLNAHIDFCLSKGAIREAQAAASGGAPRKLKPSTNTLQSWAKPTSRR
ncbi:hypothetical protein BC835DRAFT_1307867 [Cytidiella melzeri]|nr:hypothetical protein BC835DRAFT_1307867 [Cytidiella melzeri]